MKTWQKLKRDPTLFRQYLFREAVLRAIRDFFAKNQFREIEAPLLAPALPAESYLEIFETTLLNRFRKPYKAYLTASPEMYLKKLLVAGIGNCYALCKSFRNTEDFSSLHNHEFTMLEWYRVEADYKDVMKDTENLFIYIFEKLKKPKPDGKYVLTYQGKTYDLTPPWERLTMAKAFRKFANIDLYTVLTPEPMRTLAAERGYQVTAENTWEELFHQIYLNEVEPKLGQGRPTILYDFPSQMAALAKHCPDPRFAERFEVFIGGLELGDCYSELQDAQEQEKRFIAESEERKRLGKIEYPYDKDFIEALKVGLPRCSGLALGVDRTIMLFADVPTIQDTLFFPVKEMWGSEDA